METFMINSRYKVLFLLLFLTSFIGFSTQITGQRINKWNDKKESSEFIEGTYSLPVSSAITLISLHENFDEIKTGEKQKLYFSFESPSSGNYLLKVQERKVVDFYMLESKPGKISKGENAIGPWSVDDYFKKFNIPTSNLGITVKTGNEKSNYFLPASVSSKSAKNRSKEYQAIFKLSKSIRSGTVTVYKGEHKGALPNDQIIQTSKIGRQYGGGTVLIALKKKNFDNKAGWYTVSVLLSPKDSMKKIPYIFYIYHTPS